MNLFDIPVGDRPSALRALKTIALANGRYEGQERAMLQAAASAYRVEADLDALQTITAEELAASVKEPDAREHVLRACMLMSLADESVALSEISVLESFREALGVHESRMRVLHDLAKGHIRLARFHALTSMARAGRSQTNDAGVLDFLRAVGALPANRELADRCKALASLADGTLGREYVRYLERNGFAWPGEKGGTPEGAMHHDLTHVLTGYDTDPLGEIEIGSFTAGMKKTDPFMFLVFTMLEFHLGLAIRPFAAATPGHYDADRAIRAHQAGARCKRDLTDHWDFWPLMDRSVESLRAELGIES
jgi:hypothetical protein